MDLTIRSLRPEDARRRHELGRQAFGGTTPFDPDAPALHPEQVACAYLADELVGAVVTLDFAMTWGGRAVPCGGVSGVVVAPEARGRGAARRLLRESFDRMATRGQVISALYPTTASLYRSTGYEVVGWYEQRRIPLSELPTGGGAPLDWRQVDLEDPRRRALHDDMAARHDGWFRVDPTWWAIGAWRYRHEAGVNRYVYVGRRGGADVAVVQYRYGTSEDAMYGLQVEALAGVDADAVGAALGFLAGHGTTADAVVTSVPAGVLAPHVGHLQRTSVASTWPWMLRLVDAAGAVQARGFPRSVSGRVDLDVVDPDRPANAGPHVLEVGGGEATLVRGGAGSVTVTAQDLAVLYAGGDVQLLRGAGRLADASIDDLDLLAAAFVSSPTIPLFF